MASDKQAFILELRGVSGWSMASIDEGEAELRLQEYTTWFRLRSDVTGFVAPTISPEDDEITGFVPPAFDEDGIATVVQVRDHQDSPGRTIGMYHCRVEPEQLEQVRAAIAAITWRQLPMPEGGDPYTTHFTLRYISGQLMIERHFSAHAREFISAIAPLWHLLQTLTAQAIKGRSGTLEPLLSVKTDSERPELHTIRFGLRNRSIGPVVFTDPRIPNPTGPARLELTIAGFFGERDDVPTEEWRLDVPALAQDEPRSCMIATRRRWELELAWLAPKPGRYEVQARWLDYGGPLDSVPGQTPFMPLPVTGPAFIGSGPYPVRGSCWAVARFDVPDLSAGR